SARPGSAADENWPRRCWWTVRADGPAWGSRPRWHGNSGPVSSPSTTCPTTPCPGSSARPDDAVAGHRRATPTLLVMAQGKLDPDSVPDDGLTTRQRRNLPITAVHTGTGKGKSTAAFGMALRGWNQGFSIGVFQFVKSAKWKVGEEEVFRRLGSLHTETGEGGPVEWHKMGSGWSWSRKAGTEEDHAADAAEGWAEIRRRLAAETHDLYVLDEFTYPLKWGWVDVDEV